MFRTQPFPVSLGGGHAPLFRPLQTARPGCLVTRATPRRSERPAKPKLQIPNDKERAASGTDAGSSGREPPSPPITRTARTAVSPHRDDARLARQILDRAGPTAATLAPAAFAAIFEGVLLAPEAPKPSSRLLTGLFSRLEAQGAPAGLIHALFIWAAGRDELAGLLDCFLYSRVISILTHKHDSKRALSLFDRMLRSGVRPDLIAFNTAIGASARAGDADRAFELYDQLRSQGLKPDVFTFSSVISACNTGAAEGQASPFAFHSSLQTIDPLLGPSDAPPPPPPPSHAVPNWTRALRLFQDMRKMKIEANLVAYTSLITTLQRAGQLDQALTIFSEMEGRGIVPDVVAYNNMIAACSREGRWERAWALFNEMRRAGIQPSTVSYNALISACEKGNQPDRALEVFKRMKGAAASAYGYVAPNAVTYNSLLLVCGKSGLLDECARLYAEMTAAGIHPDSLTLVALLIACERSDPPQWRRAEGYFRELTETRGVRSNVFTFNSFIGALVAGGQLTRALRVFASMHPSLLPVFAKDLAVPDTAESLFADEYCDYNTGNHATTALPDQLTYLQLMRGCERAGQWELALRLYADMKERKIGAARALYPILLRCCERGWRWNEAAEILQEMEREGVKAPGLQAYYVRLISSLPTAVPAPVRVAAAAAIASGRAARKWIDRR